MEDKVLLSMGQICLTRPANVMVLESLSKGGKGRDQKVIASSGGRGLKFLIHDLIFRSGLTNESDQTIVVLFH